MPTITIYPGIAYLSGKIYCIAGRTFKQRDFAFNQVWIYNIQADAWQLTQTTYPENAFHVGIYPLSAS
jgi:hypothetical protein